MATIGLRLANVVLFVLSCSVAAGVITDVSATALIPSRVATPPPAEIEPQSQKSWREREVILERNLFGAQVVDAEVEEPEVDLKNVEESKLPYTLLGTVSSEDLTIASAALMNNTKREHEVVRIGDGLSGHSKVTVYAIERRRIVLRNGEKLEELIVDDAPQAAVRRPPPRDDRRASRRQTRNRRTRSTVRDRLQELADEDGARSPAAIFSQARILPKYEDGQMVGIELSKIKEGSFYEKAGLQDGDVVTEVNGIPIDNPSATKPLLEQLASQEELTFKWLDTTGNLNEGSFKPSDILPE